MADSELQQSTVYLLYMCVHNTHKRPQDEFVSALAVLVTPLVWSSINCHSMRVLHLVVHRVCAGAFVGVFLMWMLVFHDILQTMSVWFPP